MDRVKPYGSVFRLDHSGIKDDDKENNQRIVEIEQNIRNYLLESNEFKDKISCTYDYKVITAKRILFPILGGLSAYLVTSSFMNPKYFYIRYFNNFLGVIVGNYAANHSYNLYWESFHLRNFKFYPEEVQKAIENNDARYAMNWINKN